MLTVMSTVSFCDPFRLTFKEMRGNDTFIPPYSESACLALALMKTRYCTTINNQSSINHQSISTTINHMTAGINFLNTLRLCLVCFFKGSKLSVLIRQLNSKIKTQMVFCSRRFQCFAANSVCQQIDGPRNRQILSHLVPNSFTWSSKNWVRHVFLLCQPRISSTCGLTLLLVAFLIALLVFNFLIKKNSLFIL